MTGSIILCESELSSLSLLQDRQTSARNWSATDEEHLFNSRRILRWRRPRTRSGSRKRKSAQKVAGGEFPKPVRLSASGRAVGFLEHELEAYLDERIAERDRGYVPSASEVARIEASREGRRKARERHRAHAR